MSLLWSKNGFRGEFLARYIVSRIAFVSESTAGDDFGIDFYCGLSKEGSDKTTVYFDKPFLLQIKTTTTKPDIHYHSPSKINTLFGLQLPFFIAHLDLNSGQLDIHSTSMMWYAFHLLGTEQIEKLSFTFSNSMYDVNLANTLSNTPDIDEAKKKVRVYLGHPMISLRLADLESNEQVIEDARNIISKVIDKETANLQSKHLRLPCYRWVYEYETNKSATFKFAYNFLNNSAGLNDLDPQRIIDSMDHYLIGLAIAYKEKGDQETYESVCKITRKIDPKLHLDNIKLAFPDIYSATF